MRLIEYIKDFVKKEDSILWLSLFIASVISLLFYIFALTFVRFFG